MFLITGNAGFVSSTVVPGYLEQQEHGDELVAVSHLRAAIDLLDALRHRRCAGPTSLPPQKKGSEGEDFPFRV